MPHISSAPQTSGYDLDPDEQRLYGVIPKNGGTIGNGKARQQLGWDENLYWRVRDSLVDRGLISRGMGRGGTVFRIPEKLSKAENCVNVPSKDPKRTVSEAIAAVQREDSLYEPLANVMRGAWALDRRSRLLDVEVIARQGRRSTGGTWSRPDIVSVEVLNLLYVPTKVIEVTTFEVKPADAIDVQCVYEALAHRRAATHAYVLLHVPAREQPAITETLQTVLTVARSHGVGVVTFSNPSDYSTWDELAQAERNEPDPERLNTFIDSQLPEKIKTKIAQALR